MDELPVIASSKASAKGGKSTLFPKQMTETEINDTIWKTVQNGEVTRGGERITYELNEHGIETMSVWRDGETGMIVAAYPSGPKIHRDRDL